MKELSSVNPFKGSVHFPCQVLNVPVWTNSSRHCGHKSCNKMNKQQPALITS